MNNAKIMEKIKKVLELSKNNPSAAEAESALLMAQRLMVQYNITIEEVEGTTQEKSPEAQADYSVTSGSNTGWKVALAKIICDNFKTEVLKCGNGFTFIGMAEEVQLTISLFNFSCDIVDKGMKKVRRDARKQGLDTSGLAGDYVHGFLDGLKAKFAEQVEREGWGLILVKPEAVTEKVNELTKGSKPKAVSDRLGRRGNAEAYQRGYKQGKNLSTSKQIKA